jgi:hypothetical protein
VRRKLALVAILLLPGALAGCLGDIRQSTTPRTAQEMILLSTAAERAIAQVDTSKLAGKKVWLDASRLATYDQPYVESAFRVLLAQNKGSLVPGKDKADIAVEVRSGSLGLWDGDWGIGLPLPVGGAMVPPPGATADHWPQLISFDYALHEGWAHFQVWAYDAKTDAFVGSWRECWGRSYVGIFDDIWPKKSIADKATSYTK